MWSLSFTISYCTGFNSTCNDVKQWDEVRRTQTLWCSVRLPLTFRGYVRKEGHLLLDWGWLQATETSQSETADKGALLNCVKQHEEADVFTFCRPQISADTLILVTCLLGTLKGLVIPITPIISSCICCTTERHGNYRYFREKHKILTFGYLCKKFTFKITLSHLASKPTTDASWFYVFN